MQFNLSPGRERNGRPIGRQWALWLTTLALWTTGTAIAQDEATDKPKTEAAAEEGKKAESKSEGPTAENPATRHPMPRSSTSTPRFETPSTR